MMRAPDQLKGKVAIVTGGGRGIGRAISFALANAGCEVVTAARTSGELDETARLIHGNGGKALAVTADVSRPEAVEALVSRTVETFGHVDILVNNSGVQGAIGPLVNNDPALWVQTIQVNLIGTFLCSRAVLPAMIGQRSGKITNLSGGGATAPRPHFSAYAASKAAVVRLTECLAEEVREYNIQVNAIAPGAVNTRMLQQVLEAGARAGERALIEARRQTETGGTPAERAAALAVFLASADSDGLTGKLISAPHDDWETWDQKRISDLMAAPWYALRRIDPHTLQPLGSKRP
jgi:3-oxoacyl-[acyl-carrier protein] reductase